MTAAAFLLFTVGFTCGFLSRSALNARWTEASARRREALLRARNLARR